MGAFQRLVARRRTMGHTARRRDENGEKEKDGKRREEREREPRTSPSWHNDANQFITEKGAICRCGGGGGLEMRRFSLSRYR